MYDPIIGSFIHSLDNAASDIHVPISLLLIQILDIIFQSMPKSHYISSSFWMPGRIFTTVYWSHTAMKILGIAYPKHLILLVVSKYLDENLMQIDLLVLSN